ncbi:MAG: FAD-binding oxidoreductase, partial [Desulfurococcales archaeon]|nr:FAD-binding oxidoreductase [Desulfurococcales archaeon]
QDGSVHHDYLMLALASYASASGALLVEGAEVESIDVGSGRVRGVRIKGSGTLRAGKVVIAGGSWSRELALRTGIELPLKPVRKSLLVTTPYRFTVRPLVILFEDGGYLGQTLKGEILASGRHGDPETLDHRGVSLRWLLSTAKTLSRLLKAGRFLRILRAWSGTYNVSPDHSHMLGRDPEWPEGLYVATGYSGHGLMMAPYSGELLAKLIALDKEDRFVRVFSPERFREGRLIREGLIIG